MCNLIVTADDGFYANKRDAGISHCLSINKSGGGVGVSDVSVLMNGAVAKRLVGLSRHEQLQTSYLFRTITTIGFIPGVHLNLTEGFPLLPIGIAHTLVDQHGHLFGKFDFRHRLIGGSFGRIDLEQVERELEQQFVTFRLLFDHAPIHADGHQHIHVLPELVPLLCRVLPRQGVRWVRLPHELEENFLSSSPNISKDAIDFYKTVSSQAKAARPHFEASGLHCTDGFMGMLLMGKNQTLDAVCSTLKRTAAPLSTDGIEFMTHPGFALNPMTDLEMGCGAGPDEFACSLDREHELEFLLNDDQFASFIDQHSFQCVRFSDLPC